MSSERARRLVEDREAWTERVRSLMDYIASLPEGPPPRIVEDVATGDWL